MLLSRDGLCLVPKESANLGDAEDFGDVTRGSKERSVLST
jgi:hypothetical protein